jgi:hypothetical protein
VKTLDAGICNEFKNGSDLKASPNWINANNQTSEQTNRRLIQETNKKKNNRKESKSIMYSSM